MSEEVKVIHRPQLNKFLIRLGRGKYAFVEYEVKKDLLYVTKAYTPEEFRGRGIASKIMVELIKYAKRKGFKIVPICSFAKYFFKKHREYKHLISQS